MPENFGARLRQRREGQQIALGTIAEQTKIKQSLLEALERGDVSQWPSGIFRRAFIRAYAHAIGLEPDVVVREFLEVYPDPAEVVATVPAIGSRVQDLRAAGGPPTRLRNLVGSAIGSLSRLGARSGPKGATAADQSTAIVYTPPPDARDLFPEGAADDTSVELPASFDEPEPSLEPVHVEPVRVEPMQVEPMVVDLGEPAPAVPNMQTIAAPPPASAMPDLMAVAQVCTELGRIDNTSDLDQVLGEATRLLDAVGLIVWMWDPHAVELRPALAHGYSDRVLAQLPRVDRDTNNATAAAFQSAQTCVVNSSEDVSGALVVPLRTAGGCVGVLAIELRRRREEEELVRALAMIFAAQLAALIGAAQPAEAAGRRLA